ncbi:MAG: hypothetical protein ACK4YU_08345 [Paracoccus sp. (in: a-proteobacteria)]
MRHERRSREFPDMVIPMPAGLIGDGCRSLASLADSLLDQVVAAGNPRDLDMAIFRLRDLLFRVLIEGRHRDEMAGLLPVLSRMAALDAAYDCHLCSGLEALLTRVARLGKAVRLDPADLRAYVDHVERSGAFLAHPDARTDWSRALGPGGRA